jgi:hypothetical protein
MCLILGCILPVLNTIVCYDYATIQIWISLPMVTAGFFSTFEAFKKHCSVSFDECSYSFLLENAVPRKELLYHRLPWTGALYFMLRWMFHSKAHLFKSWSALYCALGRQGGHLLIILKHALIGNIGTLTPFSLFHSPTVMKWASCSTMLSTKLCCLVTVPKAMGTTKHELKPSKLWLKINLSSF